MNIKDKREEYLIKGEEPYKLLERVSKNILLNLLNGEASIDFRLCCGSLIHRMTGRDKYCATIARYYDRGRDEYKTHIERALKRTMGVYVDEKLSFGQKAQLLASFYGAGKKLNPRVVKLCGERLDNLDVVIDRFIDVKNSQKTK